MNKLQREYLFDSNFTRKLSGNEIMKFCDKSGEILSQYIFKERFQKSFDYILAFAVEMAFQLQTAYDLSQWNKIIFLTILLINLFTIFLQFSY